jgi:NADPH-dependent 2,4-dienoyl-CoA reductase/sulfur reductase-like enzyme
MAVSARCALATDATTRRRRRRDVVNALLLVHLLPPQGDARSAMRVCVIGGGVIGTIYGNALSKAGHEVVHFVRTGRSERVREGVLINLLDARGAEPVERTTARR